MTVKCSSIIHSFLLIALAIRVKQDFLKQNKKLIFLCSGGPLMRFHLGGTPHYYLAGVVSYGFPVGQDCGTESLPSIYTRTSEFIDWIESNVRE